MKTIVFFYYNSILEEFECHAISCKSGCVSELIKHEKSLHDHEVLEGFRSGILQFNVVDKLSFTMLIK